MVKTPFSPRNKEKQANTRSATKKQFVITKKIAKHGSQSIIVIPRVLEQHLKPGTVMQLTIDVLENAIPEDKDGN